MCEGDKWRCVTWLTIIIFENNIKGVCEWQLLQLHKCLMKVWGQVS